MPLVDSLTRSADPSSLATPAGTETVPLGRWNILVSWWSIVLSLSAGAVLGLWAFGGPFTPPSWFGAYDDPGRRLLRLAHIAAVMLPILTFHFLRALPGCAFPRRAAERWCAVLLIGAVGLPLTLALAGFWRPGLYLLPLPVTAVLLPTAALAIGLTAAALRPRNPVPKSTQEKQACESV